MAGREVEVSMSHDEERNFISAVANLAGELASHARRQGDTALMLSAEMLAGTAVAYLQGDAPQKAESLIRGGSKLTLSLIGTAKFEMVDGVVRLVNYRADFGERRFPITVRLLAED